MFSRSGGELDETDSAFSCASLAALALASLRLSVLACDIREAGSLPSGVKPMAGVCRSPAF